MFLTTDLRGKVRIAGITAFAMCVGALFVPVSGVAQDDPDAASKVAVTAAITPESVLRGGKAVLSLKLELPAGTHANSYTPVDPDLIPTAFYPKAQTGIFWGQPQYPEPTKVVEWYADEPLSVFQDGAVITASVTIGESVLPGRITLEGSLHIQVCDRKKCYPPRQLPVRATFEVVNERTAAAANKNEQSSVTKKSGSSDASSRTNLPAGRVLVADLSPQSGLAGLDFGFVDFDGRQRRFSEFRGKLVLLDFWATWCLPCLADIPKLKTIYEEYKASGFEIIGMNVETIGDEAEEPDLEFAKEAAARARQIVATRGVTWTQATNETSVPAARKIFGVKSLPTKILIDKEGKVIATVGEKDDLKAIVATLLSEKK